MQPGAMSPAVAISIAASFGRSSSVENIFLWVPWVSQREGTVVSGLERTGSGNGGRYVATFHAASGDEFKGEFDYGVTRAEYYVVSSGAVPVHKVFLGPPLSFGLPPRKSLHTHAAVQWVSLGKMEVGRWRLVCRVFG